MPRLPIGMRFDALIVVEDDGKELKMACDCGTLVTRNRNYVIYNPRKLFRSCGCKNRMIANGRFEDLTGNRYNNVVIIEDLPGQNIPNPVVTVRCDCGSKAVRVKHEVKRGKVRYCSRNCSIRKPPVDCRTRLYRSHTKAMLGHPGVAEAWHDYHQVMKDVGDVSLWIGPRDRSRPMGPDNFITFSGQKAGKIIEVDGVTNTVTGWAEHLGMSKEGTRDIVNRGALERRVRDHNRKLKLEGVT